MYSKKCTKMIPTLRRRGVCVPLLNFSPIPSLSSSTPFPACKSARRCARRCLYTSTVTSQDANARHVLSEMYHFTGNTHYRFFHSLATNETESKNEAATAVDKHTFRNMDTDEDTRCSKRMNSTEDVRTLEKSRNAEKADEGCGETSISSFELRRLAADRILTPEEIAAAAAFLHNKPSAICSNNNGIRGGNPNRKIQESTNNPTDDTTFSRTSTGSITNNDSSYIVGVADPRRRRDDAYFSKMNSIVDEVVKNRNNYYEIYINTKPLKTSDGWPLIVPSKSLALAITAEAAAVNVQLNKISEINEKIMINKKKEAKALYRNVHGTGTMHGNDRNYVHGGEDTPIIPSISLMRKPLASLVYRSIDISINKYVLNYINDDNVYCGDTAAQNVVDMNDNNSTNEKRCSVTYDPNKNKRHEYLKEYCDKVQILSSRKQRHQQSSHHLYTVPSDRHHYHLNNYEHDHYPHYCGDPGHNYDLINQHKLHRGDYCPNYITDGDPQCVIVERLAEYVQTDTALSRESESNVYFYNKHSDAAINVDEQLENFHNYNARNVNMPSTNFSNNDVKISTTTTNATTAITTHDNNTINKNNWSYRHHSPVDPDTSLLDSPSISAIPTADILRHIGSSEIRTAVAMREAELEKIVKNMEEKIKCKFIVSKGITMGSQTHTTMQRVREYLSGLPLLHLVALESAAGQLRSVIIGDEVLFGNYFSSVAASSNYNSAVIIDNTCTDTNTDTDGISHNNNHDATVTASAKVNSDTQSAANSPTLDKSLDLSLSPTDAHAAYELANLEKTEQRRRFGYVEGVHDVEEEECVLWITAAKTCVTLTS